MPATAALLVVILSIAFQSGSIISGPATPLLSVVGINTSDPWGNWWSVLTSAFYAASWIDYLVLASIVLLGVGTTERIVGSWKAIGAFIVGSLLSSLALMGCVCMGTAMNFEWLRYLGGDFILGSYGGAAAALGAGTASMDVMWRRRIRTWLLALAIMFALYVGVAQTLQFLVGAMIGVLGGRTLSTGSRRDANARMYPSPREVRSLIATIVGVFALGPVMTQVTGNFALGPLSTFAALSLQNRPDPDELSVLCGGDYGCILLQSRVGINSPGAVILTLIPLLLLLLCSDGLRRGRQLALRTALVINMILAAVVLVQLLNLVYWSGSTEVDFGILVVYILPAVIIPGAIAGLLFVVRGRFRVNSSPAATRSMVKSAGILSGAVMVGYAISWLAEGNLERSTINDLLLQLTHVLIPFPLPFTVQLPRGFITTLTYGFGGVVIWLVFAILAFRNFRLFHIGGLGDIEDMDKARGLLQRGGGTLSYMALWENNTYWFSPDGQACVAYQVHNGVALTLAGPFGVPAAKGEAARAFVTHSLELGLIPCFYSATSDVGDALEGMNFQALGVAEETLLHTANLSFRGKEWQNVRTALNRAEKLGIKDHWYRYPSMPPGLRAQLTEISTEWMAGKALPEMGFTLGGLQELEDENVLCCAAVDEAGLVHGITSWLPVYSEGQVTGWTLDFMRRRTTGFKGVMEFLIASAVTHFRTEIPTISLSGSPLANAGAPTGSGDGSAVQKFLSALGGALEPMYGFKSLAAFKSRFRPEHRTLYMYYQDPLSLPSIGMAITAAHLPDLSPKQSTLILRALFAKQHIT